MDRLPILASSFEPADDGRDAPRINERKRLSLVLDAADEGLASGENPLVGLDVRMTGGLAARLSSSGCGSAGRT